MHTFNYFVSVSFGWQLLDDIWQAWLELTQTQRKLFIFLAMGGSVQLSVLQMSMGISLCLSATRSWAFSLEALIWLLHEIIKHHYDIGSTNYYPARRLIALPWRQNGRNCVSNHQPHHCLLNRLSRRRSKNTSKPRYKGPVTRKMFPFDDVIMDHEVQQADLAMGVVRTDFTDLTISN